MELDVANKKQTVVAIEEEKNFFGQDQQTTSTDHLNNSAKTATKTEKDKAHTPFIYVISYMFAGGNAVAGIIFLVEIVLIFTQGIDTVSHYFSIFNLLSLSWTNFSFLFCLSFSPSVTFLRISHVMLSVLLPLQMVWVYYTLSLVAVVIFAYNFIFSVTFGLMCTAAVQRYSAGLPFDSKSFQAWMTTFRFFILMTAPIVAKALSNGDVSPAAFYAIWIFSFASGTVCATLRRQFYRLPNADSSAALFYKLPIRTITLAYGPATLMFCAFFAFYVIYLSGSEATVQDSVIIGLLCLFMLSAILQQLTVLATFSRLPVLAWIRP